MKEKTLIIMVILHDPSNHVKYKTYQQNFSL